MPFAFREPGAGNWEMGYSVEKMPEFFSAQTTNIYAIISG